MKPDVLRLAWLFHDAGLIDAATFEKVAGRQEKTAKSSLVNLFSQLNRDVSVDTVRDSLKGVRDLMLMEVRLPSSASDVPDPSELHDALSQPIYMTNREIEPILERWKPPVETLVHIVGEVGDAGARERIEKIGAQVSYKDMVEKDLLTVRTLNRAAATLVLRIKRLNRLLLALEILRTNDAMSDEDYRKTWDALRQQEKPQPPQISDLFADFADRDPEAPGVEPLRIDPDDSLREAFPVDFMRRNLFVPIRQSEDRLEIATPDPFYVALTDTLSLLTDKPVLAWHTPASLLIGRINELFPGEKTARVQRPADEEQPATQRPPQAAVAEKAPEMDSVVDRRSAVEIVSSIIENGIASRATDVHLEPREDKKLRVRYRIDGRLRPVLDVPADLGVSVVSRIKVLGSLDVTERRRPQDGHFSLRFGQGAFDFRISTLPTHLGEKIVIRILDESQVMLELSAMGMLPRQVTQFKKWISRPHGLVLVTGPTGSGKTSTLYAGLNALNSEDKNLVTIEDPVEYRLDGINQVQVDPNIDLTFAQGLRSTLRQDPDVIMVGEVRDPETAWIALRAALTGHLVLSTLHTNTAAGAIATLLQMEAEPFMLVSAISGVVSQRLLRRLCEVCKKSFVPKKELRESLGLDPKSRKRMFRAIGCAECFNSGYRGRTGVFELLEMSDDLGQGILERRSESELVKIGREAGVASLYDNAMVLAREGVTSPEEVLERIMVE